MKKITKNFAGGLGRTQDCGHESRLVRELVDRTMFGLQLFVGTHMVWGVNLGFNNVTNAVNMAKAILNAFISPEVIESGVVLERIEVGAYH